VSGSVRWTGLAEFRQQLRTLPDDLAGEAGAIVLASGQNAFNEVMAGYPEITGNLKRGLKLSKSSAGRFGASVRLSNRARHAWLFDHGSQARHYVTKSGATHVTGKMWGRTAPTHVFVRAVMKHKRYMIEFLKNMVRRHGLKVAGE
jgi:hypothetical protein